MSYLRFDKTLMTNLSDSLQKEVLRSNRSGAYACTTIVDCNTRKYHGLLVVPVPELDDEPADYVVTGPSMLTGLPQTITLSYNEIAYALDKSLVKLDNALMEVLEEMPPELYSDVVKNGIYLAGGGALIKGLDQRLSKKSGLPVHIAEDPLRAIARGTCIALKNIGNFSFLMGGEK